MARQPGSRARDYNVTPSTNRFGPKAVEPFSPWQLMVEKAREQEKLSLRELGTRAQIPAGTLFNWVRAPKGAPPRVAYTANINRRLAKALKIPEKQLAKAYNESAFRPIDPSADEPDPRPAPHLGEKHSSFTVDGLKRFLHQLKATGRDSFTLLELELAASMILGSVKPLDDSPPDIRGK